MTRDRVDVLGVGVDRVDRAAMLDRVGALVAARGRATVAYANVHVLNVAARDPALAAFLNAADLCYCDGDGVRLGARLLGERLPERMTGADWIWDYAARAEAEGWRTWWIAGEPGVVDVAARNLRARHPGLRIGGDHGFCADDTPIRNANAFGADVVLVGMGTPLQERWVARHRPELEAPVVWVVGATADFVSGKVSRGPTILNQNAEWLARLVTEPRRLWRRYLLGNTRFLGRVVIERVRAGPGSGSRGGSRPR
ncbi:MAG: WecB/TagA/CpsF family glycosyltransferase [Myxococcota bacterium]